MANFTVCGFLKGECFRSEATMLLGRFSHDAVCENRSISCRAACRLVFNIVLIVNKSCGIAKTSVFLCNADLHCCPRVFKNTLKSHAVELGDVFLHYNEHGFYFESIQQTLSWCYKYSLVQQIRHRK